MVSTLHEYQSIFVILRWVFECDMFPKKKNYRKSENKHFMLSKPPSPSPKIVQFKK